MRQTASFTVGNTEQSDDTKTVQANVEVVSNDGTIETNVQFVTLFKPNVPLADLQEVINQINEKVAKITANWSVQ